MISSKNKKILFTGGTGLLGRYFLKIIPAGFFVFATYLNNKADSKDGSRYRFLRLDIRDKERVLQLVDRLKPEIIVHAASLGNVDYCQQHKKEAWSVNVEGTKNILSACQKNKSRMIFTSSNAIYNGVHSKFSEKSTPKPLNYYGLTKYAAEKEIKKRSKDFVIVRLMTMYGWNHRNERLNPVTWLIEKLSKKERLNIVNDIYNNHLWAGQAVKVLWKIIKENKTNEVYNIAGGECISRFELALKVTKVFGFDKSLISPVPSSFFKSIAPRPKNTCFDTVKIEKELGIRPLKMLDGLKRMKNEL